MWLALALVLFYLPSFGLANNEHLLEVLVEGPSTVNANSALLINPYADPVLVQHHHRGISNAVW